MAACLFGGPLLFVARWTGLPLPPVLAHAWLGWALLGAGIWALLSSERLVVNLRQKSWTRQEGSLAAVRVTKGPLDELDALVVTVRPNPSGGGVIYDLVLHWKLARRPPLPLERMPLRLPGGMPTQAGAGPLVAKAADYGAWMGLPVYDNTQAFSGSPVPWV
ncbi:MAG: hypothetical protein MH204_11070 [Fimbriimonadaceae bacterium]|nr:hypothetical protein [Fimbriimonadaceae bacterium]